MTRRQLFAGLGAVMAPKPKQPVLHAGDKLAVKWVDYSDHLQHWALQVKVSRGTK